MKPRLEAKPLTSEDHGIEWSVAIRIVARSGNWKVWGPEPNTCESLVRSNVISDRRDADLMLNLGALPFLAITFTWIEATARDVGEDS